MADIFSTDPVDIDLAFNDLVGEDKKYKDPDALAKAYANIERHTRTLEAEQAAARAKIDALEATKRNSDGSQNQDPDPSRQPDPANPNPNPAPKQDVDLRSQIQTEIKAQSEQERARQNIDSTAQKMVDQYGSPAAANEAIRKRAQELGVSVETLRDSAATSPSYFFATMGVPATGVDRSTPAPHNDFVQRDGNRDLKDFEHFDKLRKDNPKAYYLPATQKEMLAQAKKMGADFYKR